MKKRPERKTKGTESAATAPGETTAPRGEASPGDPFPVVGIGASAGGLEALELFLRNVPPENGTAFVIVQHLDPTHKGIMVELLQRTTAMKVLQVRDRMRVELRAIKEKAGAVFVQSPGSAKFDGMPRSAIDAGLADVVAPAEELPDRIMAYIRHVSVVTRADLALEDKAQSALEKIFILLRAQTGQDFSLYKKSTIYRRIERRMGLHQIDRIAAYVRFLRENPQEAELLFKELLIGVTGFFRDPAAWEYLGKEVIPALLAARPAGTALRAWTPGCSTGEEAYSLAIVFREALGRVKPAGSFSLQVFATDLDRDAIEKARLGVYPANITADVSPERLQRFFVQEERGYRVAKEIREMVVFAPQNLIMDAPFTKLDLLVCRNLLIYLVPELQKKLLPLFHYSLNPGGCLFLGSAETIGAFTDLFSPVDVKARIYRRLDAPPGARPIEFPTAFTAVTPESPEPAGAQKPAFNLQQIADQLLLARYTPAAVVTNNKGDILYISGRTGKYLEPAAGKANWSIFAMAREGLRYELGSAFQKALRRGETISLKGAKVQTNGNVQAVDITVQPLSEPDELKGMVMIVFADAAAPPGGKAPASRRSAVQSTRLAQAEQELNHCREELQNTREEMQTSQEELKSSNEELQSTNEELQSTNEELTTSREEMQSMNEELQTVNHELLSKVGDLSRANNDMKNLLDSTDIATLFLDGELRVRSFTSRTAKVIKLIPGDAGRPVTDIASELIYPDLVDDAREVLRTLVFKETVATTAAGRWYMVRILPYRTRENRIDGVVITFTDVTDVRKVESDLREGQSDLRKQVREMAVELKEAKQTEMKSASKGRRRRVTRTGGGEGNK